MGRLEEKENYFFLVFLTALIPVNMPIKIPRLKVIPVQMKKCDPFCDRAELIITITIPLKKSIFPSRNSRKEPIASKPSPLPFIRIIVSVMINPANPQIALRLLKQKV